MHLVIDYGGVVVDHGDEREQAHLLGVDPDTEPYPGTLAYFAFRGGLVQTTAGYLDLLSTLTGASEEACREYLQQTWLDPEFPEERADVLRELAVDHTLVLFSNMARPWVETILSENDVRDCFDDLVVSSDLGRPKPHPKGYVESLPDADSRNPERGGAGPDRDDLAPAREEPVVFVSDEYNEDLLMGEAFGMQSVWVKNDEETPYREPDARISTLADLPDVLSSEEFTTDGSQN